MSIYRSIELRKNTSGSYKVRLTIDRGSKFCGARKSLGLGTHQEDCALRRAYLMRCLLFHMGWFPGGKIAVRNSAECGIKEVVWDSMDCIGDSGMFRLTGRGCRVATDETMVIWFQTLRHLHFEEAAELAYFGAKILHPTCVQPAKYANIPVRLLNTMEPTAPGTLISNDTEKGKIKAVAAKDNITAIKIKSSRMLLAHGFLRKVFEIFESYQTSIDMICTSEVGVSVSIDNTKHLNEILDDLKKYGTVTVDQDMCIICVVGDLEWENVGFEAKALDAMRDIPVRMISFGGSNYNISFLIREEDKKKALQSLSDHLFNNK